jgi:hypothetical protein
MAAAALVPLLLLAGPWVHEGPRPSFTIAGGVITTSGAGHIPNWLRSDREYEDFRLRLEYRLNQWAEAAVILRAPRAGRPIHSGVAIQLAHDFHNQITPHVTGAVVGVRAPAVKVAGGYGAWHSLDITFKGDRLKAAIDGITVQDGDVPDKPGRGFIGFADLGHGYSVRNVEIEDLGAPARYVDLFDGRSLDGWGLRGAGQWSAREGVITGANGHGILYAPRPFADFEFSALVRGHNHVNGGIFLRGSPDEKQPRGFEVQIYNVPDAVYPTGSVYGIQRSRISADYDGQWVFLEIRVRGRHCRVRVNGDTVAETGKLPPARSGRIGLQIHLDNASVEFRDLRVRPL